MSSIGAMMEIMESLKPRDKIFCQIRKNWVKATPEEKIRQELLHHLIHQLGFPRSHLVVEKGLHQMPHLVLEGKKFPLRRADIVCFGKGIHPEEDLYPLLLIECKATKITQRMISQVIGYNHFLKSYFIAISNGQDVQTGWWDPIQKTYLFVPHIPRYTDLLLHIKAIKRLNIS